jgi:hypothetical protein
MYPSDYYTVLGANASALSAPALYQASDTYFNSGSLTDQRWGTYSIAVADPSNANGFWLSNEYVSTAVTGPDGSPGWWDTVTAQALVGADAPSAPTISSIVTIVNSANTTAASYTTTDTNNAWSVSVTGAQATAFSDGSYTAIANVSDKAGNAAASATRALTVDEDKVAEAPTLALSNASLTVQAGGSVPLGITATPVDSDDQLSVKISGVPSYESIMAPSGYNETSKRQSNGTYTWTVTESSSKTGTSLTGLTLTSHYKGTGHPTATLTVTASDVTSGEAATSAPQTIVVTDPPAIASSSPSILPLAGLLSPAYSTLAGLFDQYMAAESGRNSSGLSQTTWTASPQPGFGETEFLTRPHV